MKRPLTDRIKRDSRSEIARWSMILRIHKDAGYKEFPEVLKAWSAKQVDSVFLTYKWKPDASNPQEVMNRYGDDKAYTVADFEAFCVRSPRENARHGYAGF
ncbi:MAG: hypothetical protein R2778_04300 [Saprospiraceae bacterium]